MNETATTIADRLELFVDDALIAELAGDIQQFLHHPTRTEDVFVADAPWEGNLCGYMTVLQDDDRYRMYYTAQHAIFDRKGEDGLFPTKMKTACIESNDGRHWQRLKLGHCLPEHPENNIVWAGPQGVHGFSPFRDSNPSCSPNAVYKAVGGDAQRNHRGVLHAFTSQDGLTWQQGEKPITTDGAYDSQSVAFWDSVRHEYRAYYRQCRDGRRDILTATSPDFANWTNGEWLEYPSAAPEQLYTNQVIPYYRAPHIFLAFPTRYVERKWSPTLEALPEREHREMRAAAKMRIGSALTDGLFMSSRDGKVFNRWSEAFIRPGPQQQGNWTYGDNYQCWGLLELPSQLRGAPPELSLYVTEDYWRNNSTTFRRHRLRIDGFVSLRAGASGGEMISELLTFSGRNLALNAATSAAGSLRVELQTPDRRPIPGFTLDDCWEVVGDSLNHTVQWKQGNDLESLIDTPVHVRYELKDADLYSMRFADA